MGLPTTSLASPADQTHTHPSTRRSRIYPWIAFALVFALMLSDYMSRQVLSSVFPFLKAEWALSDSQLASLTSAVALTVGVLAFPLSLLADRWGRVKCMIVMAVIWSLATLLCAVAGSYGEMLGARLLVGVGEAAYGSVGAAVVIGVFAPRLRASIAGTFLAGGSFGSVIGVAFGGVLAVHLGWRWSFAAMAVFGLILVGLFAALVNERRLAQHAVDETALPTATPQPDGFRAPTSSLFASPSLVFAYIGSGLQMFVTGVLLAWLPSYFNRYNAMAPDRAGVTAAAFVLLAATGMMVCGIITDRVSRSHPAHKWTAAIAYCSISLVLLPLGFTLGDGTAQLLLLGGGAFFSAGSAGAVAAMVADLTHPTIRASAFGTITLGNNILGLALGPFVVGILADEIGLKLAMQLTPLVYIAAIAALIISKRGYPAGLRRLATLQPHPPA